eukprot:s1553_g3.t1
MAVSSASQPAGLSSNGLALPWRGRARSASPPPISGVLPSSTLLAATSSRRHFPSARAEQTAVNEPPPRVRCALTPSVVAPWLLPAEREPQMERGRRGQGEVPETPDVRSLSSLEKKDAQRHLQLFGIPNLELTSHKGSRQGLRHSISVDVLAVSPKANSAIPEKTPKKRESCPQAIAPEFYAQPPRPTRGLPIKANFARLTGPALRALAEAEVVELSEASRELPLPRVSRITRVSFKPPSRALEIKQDPNRPSDLTKTSAQSLTTAASHGASQASLASTGSLHEASPVETSPLAGTSPLAEASDAS